MKRSRKLVLERLSRRRYNRCISKLAQQLADEIDQEILRQLINNHEKEVKHCRD